MQILPAWLPDAGELLAILFTLHAIGGHAGTICLRLAALGYNLNTPGRQSHAILHAPVGSTMKSSHFLESTLPKQLFEFKNKKTIKKSKNLRDACTM
jgi:hypothetical protein